MTHSESYCHLKTICQNTNTSQPACLNFTGNEFYLVMASQFKNKLFENDKRLKNYSDVLRIWQQRIQSPKKFNKYNNEKFDESFRILLKNVFHCRLRLVFGILLF